MGKDIWRFNRGEWTEAYVFLKLLSDGKIYGATEDLKKDLSKFIKIVSVTRPEKENFVLKYEPDFDSIPQKVSAMLNETEFAVITVSELTEKANFLYKSLKTFSAQKKDTIPEIQEFLEKLKFSSPKIPSLPKSFENEFGRKTDIIVTIINSEDGAVSTDGFSIKSHMGSPSSLFNYGDGSRMIFKIVGCTEKRMHEINLIEDELKIIQAIKDDKDLSLEFVKTGKEEFAGNLEYIDTQMLKIITMTMLVQTKYLSPAKSGNLRDIVNVVSELNPLNVMYPEHFYEAKFKDFLFASLAGLTASKKWDGKTRMTGGYIDVNKDGELLYYRAISNEIFCSYLYENTFIDQPDRGHNKDIAIEKAKAYFENRTVSDAEIKAIKKAKDKKGNCGFVYEENGEYFIAINFQVRFR